METSFLSILEYWLIFVHIHNMGLYVCTSIYCMNIQRVYTVKQSKSLLQVPWRSVHRQTDHATFRPRRSVHPTNRLLWQFTTVTFRLKVDGLSVHPKMWHSNLVNLDGLSQSDKLTHCIVLTQSLWHFIHVFFIHCHLKGLSYEIFFLVLSVRQNRSPPTCAKVPIWSIVC